MTLLCDITDLRVATNHRMYSAAYLGTKNVL